MQRHDDVAFAPPAQPPRLASPPYRPASATVARRPRWTCRKSNGAPGRGRSAKRSHLYDAMHRYSTHFRALLSAELQAEQASSSFVGMTFMAQRRRRSLSSDVYLLRASEDRTSTSLHQLNLNRGDLLDVCVADNQYVQGTVMSTDSHKDSCLLSFPLGSDAARRMERASDVRDVLSVRYGVSTLAHDRAVAALDAVSAIGPGTSPLARLLVSSFVPTAPAPSLADVYATQAIADAEGEGEGVQWEAMAVECPDTKSLSAIRITDTMRKLIPRHALNESQRAAVRAALSRRLTLVHGPPGTGKTATTAVLVRCAARLGARVLAVAASNAAVDNLARTILQTNPSTTNSTKSNSRVLRVGRAAVVAHDVIDFTLDARLEQDATVRRARDAAREGKVSTRQMLDVERSAADRLVNAADIVLSTCVNCGGVDIADKAFDIVVVDEATQAVEPDVLIALCTGAITTRQVVLVGDHFQLPPTTISSTHTTGNGLDISLFSRLCTVGVRPYLLNVQYRMHPDVSNFPHKHFYSKRVSNAPGTAEARALPVPEKLPAWMRARVILVDQREGRDQHERHLKHTSSSSSLLNAEEATTVAHVVHSILRAGGFSQSDIGVISPYNAQVRRVREMLRRNAQGVEVNSVDAFQGREKNVIVISAVRSNEQRRIGFLADWRRLNVAITRARSIVVVVCNVDTVTADKHWKAFISSIRHTVSPQDIAR